MICSLEHNYNHLDLTSLILFDDSIAILNSTDKSVYDIWLLIQPGAAGVWNKLLTFKCPSHITKSCYCGFWDSSTLIFLAKKKKKMLGPGTRGISNIDTRARGMAVRFIITRRAQYQLNEEGGKWTRVGPLHHWLLNKSILNNLKFAKVKFLKHLALHNCCICW